MFLLGSFPAGTRLARIGDKTVAIKPHQRLIVFRRGGAASGIRPRMQLSAPASQSVCLLKLHLVFFHNLLILYTVVSEFFFIFLFFFKKNSGHFFYFFRIFLESFSNFSVILMIFETTMMGGKVIIILFVQSDRASELSFISIVLYIYCCSDYFYVLSFLSELWSSRILDYTSSGFNRNN